MPDHSALVVAVIVDCPTCRDCVAAKTRTTAAALEATLAIIEKALVLHHAYARCRACGEVTTVLSLERPK